MEEATASRPRDSFADEQYTLLKPPEISTSADIIYSILVFLDASPLTLFVGAPNNGADWTIFFEEISAAITTYLVTDDARIRYLTNTVVIKLMAYGSVALWRKSKNLGSQSFKYHFWKST